MRCSTSSHPDWPFFRTRKETPSKYEAYVDPRQSGLKCVIRTRVSTCTIRNSRHYFVNDLKLGGQAKGAVALAPDITHYRNLTITAVRGGDAR